MHDPLLLNDPPAPIRISTKALFVLFLCSLAYVLDGLTNSIIGAVAPGIGRSLNLGPQELGSVFLPACSGSPSV